jgi:hypothetical protein
MMYSAKGRESQDTSAEIVMISHRLTRQNTECEQSFLDGADPDQEDAAPPPPTWVVDVTDFSDVNPLGYLSES